RAPNQQRLRRGGAQEVRRRHALLFDPAVARVNDGQSPRAEWIDEIVEERSRRDQQREAHEHPEQPPPGLRHLRLREETPSARRTTRRVLPGISAESSPNRTERVS